MKMTYKAIARSAGYYAYTHTASNGKLLWAWRESASWGSESATRTFDSEEDAYKNCCAVAGLVDPSQNGLDVRF